MPQANPLFQVPDGLSISPDPILGLSRLVNQDPRPNKIDAGIGVYRGEGGTFTPTAVRHAEKRISDSVDYLGPSGDDEALGYRPFLDGTSQILFADRAQELIGASRLVRAGTVGGSGAVRLMIDTFNYISPGSPVLLGSPTWPNHVQILKDTKTPVIQYSHMQDNKYDLNAHLEAINNSPQDTLVLFHGGKMHNPTGVNPSTDGEWEKLAESMEGRRAFFDIAYAGFGDGLMHDTQALRIFAEHNIPVAASISYAKNAGLYNERPAALMIVGSNRNTALELQRVVNNRARSIYSSPPAHGEKIMGELFSDPDLLKMWERELGTAAVDLRQRRVDFSTIVPQFSFVADQTGLFSMLPLNKDQVQELRQKHAVYMPDSGRVNFGGITAGQIPQFAEAVKAVL